VAAELQRAAGSFSREALDASYVALDRCLARAPPIPKVLCAWGNVRSAQGRTRLKTRDELGRHASRVSPKVVLVDQVVAAEFDQNRLSGLSEDGTPAAG